MKNTFKEHHITENLEDIYKNSIIVLDTNSVLNLYRYSESNRKKYFEILKAPKKKIFLFEDAGHSVLTEKPEEVQKIIIEEILKAS